MTDNIKSVIGVEFKKYLYRYFDDYDNDNYKRLVAAYPVLWEDFICHTFKFPKT